MTPSPPGCTAPSDWDPKETFPPKVFLSGISVSYFVAATRQVATHSCLTELAGWKLAWTELVKRRGCGETFCPKE